MKLHCVGDRENASLEVLPGQGGAATCVSPLDRLVDDHVLSETPDPIDWSTTPNLHAVDPQVVAFDAAAVGSLVMVATAASGVNAAI